MPVKLFILGLPGSGKSAAAHYIETFARMTGWTPKHLKDYPILLAMFEEDMKRRGRRFRPTEDHEYKGFNALDFAVFDEALQILEGQISEVSAQNGSEKQLLMIEFARDNYEKSLDIFSSHLPQDAYFLFIEAEIDACKQRILDRVKNPRTEDDHYVSEAIFKSYYKKDLGHYAALVVPQLKERYGIPERNIRVIKNDHTVPKGDFDEEVKLFVSSILLASP